MRVAGRWGAPAVALAVLGSVCAAMLPAGSSWGDGKGDLRWVFVHSRLVAPGGEPELERILRRAAAAGANGIVLAEGTLATPDPVTQADEERFGRIRRLADELGLELIPAVFGPRSILAANPNLAEAMPVRDALFVARNGTATHEADPPVRLENPGFEKGTPARPQGWEISVEGGLKAEADTAVRRSGRQSLRFSGAPDGMGSGRLVQTASVPPWRQYHFSVWVRTRGCASDTALQPWLLAPDGRPLNYSRWVLQKDGDWTQFHAVFNSQEHRAVRVQLSVYRLRGTLWLDDVELAETALVNLARRAGCPLTVSDEKGQTYEENRDYEPVADARLGRSPVRGAYSVYHDPPAIRLTRDSRIPDGARLRVSFYHVPIVYENRVTQCLVAGETYDLMAREVERVRRLIAPKTWFMSHDEMRVLNWCQECRATGKTPGQLLAENVRRCVELIRRADPLARIAVWSDMFDPHHNARKLYYLANGSLEGSWEGLPSDVLIVNWNSTAREQSLRWFASRGHRQIIAAYYDHDLGEVRKWQDAARSLGGVEGLMYTTWNRSYVDLEAFARLAWGEAR